MLSKNPRHTSQSWRDRWVKYVSYRPRPEANGDSDSEGDNAGDSQLPLSINRMYHPSISGAPTQGSLLSAAQDRPFQAATPKQTEGQQDVQTARPCSMRDKQQLLDAYDDIMDLPDDSVIAAWTGWADMVSDSSRWSTDRSAHIVLTVSFSFCTRVVQLLQEQDCTHEEG